MVLSEMDSTVDKLMALVRGSGTIADGKATLELIKHIAGDNGVPLVLKVVRDNTRIEDEDRNQLNPLLRKINEYAKAIADDNRHLAGKELLVALEKFNKHLNDLCQSTKQFGAAGFCGTSSREKQFKTKFKNLIGYDKFFQALNCVQSNVQSYNNEALEKLRADITAILVERQRLAQNHAGPAFNSVPKEKDPISARVLGKRQQSDLNQVLLGLGLQQNPSRVLQLLPNLQNSQWIYGRMYEEGMIVERNIETAKQWYEKARRKGQAEGTYRLGSLIEREVDNSRNFQEQDYVALLEQAAKAGHMEAISDLGFIYQRGLHGPGSADLNRAHQLYLRGAKAKFPRAMNNLASLYMSNDRLKQQMRPIALLEQACELGYSKAFLNLAICYEKGKLVEADRARAMNLFRKGADRGDQESKLFWVFNLIQQASQRQEDWDQAQMYCLQVVAEDPLKPEGYYFLGYMYEMGLGCPKQEQTSFLYYLKAARLKYPAAINKVADFYHSGFGVAKSNALAFKYYKSAAELGNPEALINLAYIYEEGYDGVVTSDTKKAVELYEQASDLGSSQAMMILYDLYESGRNVRKNNDKAQSYLKRAAALGSDVARKLLDERSRGFSR